MIKKSSKKEIKYINNDKKIFFLLKTFQILSSNESTKKALKNFIFAFT